MIKSSRTVLRELRNLSNNSEDVLSFLGNTNCICRDDDTDKTFDYSKYQGEIHTLIKALVTSGYLQYDINEFHFALTHRGLHPYQYQWETIKHFLLTSIFVPIVVSVITTLLTLLVQWLLTKP